MMDRRRLLMTAALGGAFATSGAARALAQAAGAPAAAPAGPASTQFLALLDKIAQEMILSDPETLTALGMDRGPMAAARFKLSDRSQAKIDADKAKFNEGMAAVKAIDKAQLTATEQTYYDSLEFFGDTVQEGYAFPYGAVRATGLASPACAAERLALAAALP